MSDLLSRSDVLRVAKLARLTLSDADADHLAHDLSNILSYVKKLEELDTANVAPTSHAVELPTLLRPDILRPGLPVETALQNAPERISDGFGVPKIIE